jgi:hypothetical protein
MSVPSSTAFSYSLTYTNIPSTCAAVTATACSITTTSSENPASVSSFPTNCVADVYTAGPFASNSVAGIYTVQVNQITLSGLAFTPIGTTSFALTATDPACLAAVIITSTVTAPTFNVFAALAYYTVFLPFTYTSASGPSACGSLTYSATETPPTGVSSLSVFTFLPATNNF